MPSSWAALRVFRAAMRRTCATMPSIAKNKVTKNSPSIPGTHRIPPTLVKKLAKSSCKILQARFYKGCTWQKPVENNHPGRWGQNNGTKNKTKHGQHDTTQIRWVILQFSIISIAWKVAKPGLRGGWKLKVFKETKDRDKSVDLSQFGDVPGEDITWQYSTWKNIVLSLSPAQTRPNSFTCFMFSWWNPGQHDLPPCLANQDPVLIS